MAVLFASGGVMIKSLILAVLLLLVAGLVSAGERTFVPVPSEGQLLEYDQNAVRFTYPVSAQRHNGVRFAFQFA